MINTNFNMPSVNWFSGGTSFAPTQRSFGTSNSSLFGGNHANSSAGFQSALLTMRSAADNMRTSLNTMRGTGVGGRNASPFGIAQATSADTKMMTIASVDTSRLRNANPNQTQFNVDIMQVATAQRNEGSALQANARATDSGFSVGSHSIALTVGNRQFDINFQVSANDSNRDVQNRIAAAINQRGVGVSRISPSAATPSMPLAWGRLPNRHKMPNSG
jgi:hypothetical protein